MADSSSRRHELSTDELVQLIGHEVRMSVMRSLWDAFDYEQFVLEEQSPIPFQELYTPSPSDSTGNFNYHLQQLVDVLIEKQGDGYVLTPWGYNIMQALDNYAAFEYVSLDPTTLGTPCPFCGGVLEGSYDREQVHVSCRDCGGLGGDGNITFVKISSKGLEGLQFAELIDLSILSLEARVRSSQSGFCWECNAELDRTLDRCRTHDQAEDGTCPDCNARFAVTVDVSCPHCGVQGHGPAFEYALIDSAVRSFLREHGHGPQQVGHWRARVAALSGLNETITEENPMLVRYSIEVDDDAITVEIAEGDRIRSVPVKP